MIILRIRLGWHRIAIKMDLQKEKIRAQCMTNDQPFGESPIPTLEILILI
jgi:hypothetical protein